MNTLSQILLSTLTDRGYDHDVTTDENNIIVRCIINVSAVTFLLDTERGVVEFGNSHVLIPAATEEMLTGFKGWLREERTPFTDIVYEDKDDEHLLFLAGRLAKDDFTADTVNAIVDTVESKDGIVAKLKEMSLPKKEHRSADDLAQGKEILNRAIDFFASKGYIAKFWDENTLQIDCTINGNDLAVVCEGTEYSFGIDCGYYTDKPLPEEKEETLFSLFEKDSAPFKNLHFFEDCFRIEAEFPYSEFSTELLEQVIEFLTRKDGFSAEAKRISEEV